MRVSLRWLSAPAVRLREPLKPAGISSSALPSPSFSRRVATSSALSPSSCLPVFQARSAFPALQRKPVQSRAEGHRLASSASAAEREPTSEEKANIKKEELKRKDVPLGMLKADGTSKRFYKQAGVQQVKQDCPRTGMLRTMWSLTLDGRGVRTPANKLLTVPTKEIAMAIAMEFDVQDLNILPYTMPLTTLATTSIDQISRSDVRQSTIQSLLRQFRNDLVTLRSNDPPDLVEREEKIWGRVCYWAEEHYKFKLVVSHEWLQAEQPEDIMNTVRDDLLARSDWRLTVIDQVAGSTGSLILSLALSQGFLSADEAIKAARLSEDYNIERWGMVKDSGMGGHDIDAADMRSRSNVLQWRFLNDCCGRLAAAWLYNRLLPTEYR